MKERFTDLAWTDGDFNKATTSPSQTALQNSIWFIKYHLSPHLNFKPEKPSISFEAGKFVHEWFQQILIGQAEIKDVELHFKTFISNFDFGERNNIKAQFILRNIKGYVERHLMCINELSDNFSDWKVEEPLSDWYDDKYMGQTLNLATEGYIDCVNHNEKKITEHKNRFGSARNSPLKINRKDSNVNRIGDWVYSKSQPIKQPQFTHCIQTAVYSKHYNYEYKPYLIYVSDGGSTTFTSDNCWELTPEGLQYFFRKFIQINIKRQELLRASNGSIKKLACLVDVDWSEIRNFKSNFMLENYDEEDMQRLEDFYEKL